MSGGAALAQRFLARAELAEELAHRRGESVIVEAVDDVLALALVDDQIGLLEHGQMARDGRLRQVEVADDLADGALVALEEPQDLLAGVVRESLENLGQVPLVAPPRSYRTSNQSSRLPPFMSGLGLESRSFTCGIVRRHGLNCA